MEGTGLSSRFSTIGYDNITKIGTKHSDLMTKATGNYTLIKVICMI